MKTTLLILTILALSSATAFASVNDSALGSILTAGSPLNACCPFTGTDGKLHYGTITVGHGTQNCDHIIPCQP
jgi:hypothetical protein